MSRLGVIKNKFIGYSRQSNEQKVSSFPFHFNLPNANRNSNVFLLHSQEYVQDLIRKNASVVRNLILNREAYVYVCGSTSMASEVEDTINAVLASKSTSGSYKNFIKALQVLYNVTYVFCC